MKPWLEPVTEPHPAADSIEIAGRARMRLYSAAPALVRALLAVEQSLPCDQTLACPFCMGTDWNEDDTLKHAEACPIDAALTAAGLPDQASRDAARKEMR